VSKYNYNKYRASHKKKYNKRKEILTTDWGTTYLDNTVNATTWTGSSGLPSSSEWTFTATNGTTNSAWINVDAGDTPVSNTTATHTGTGTYTISYT